MKTLIIISLKRENKNMESKEVKTTKKKELTSEEELQQLKMKAIESSQKLSNESDRLKAEGLKGSR